VPDGVGRENKNEGKREREEGADVGRKMQWRRTSGGGESRTGSSVRKEKTGDYFEKVAKILPGCTQDRGENERATGNVFLKPVATEEKSGDSRRHFTIQTFLYPARSEETREGGAPEKAHRIYEKKD